MKELSRRRGMKEKKGLKKKIRDNVNGALSPFYLLMGLVLNRGLVREVKIVCVGYNQIKKKMLNQL